MSQARAARNLIHDALANVYAYVWAAQIGRERPDDAKDEGELLEEAVLSLEALLGGAPDHAAMAFEWIAAELRRNRLGIVRRQPRKQLPDWAAQAIADALRPPGETRNGGEDADRR